MSKKIRNLKVMFCVAGPLFLFGKNCFSMSDFQYETFLSEFHGISKISVSSDEGNVKILKSKDDVTRVYTAGPDASKAVIQQSGDILKINNKRGFWGFGPSRHVNFLIELGNKLSSEVDISQGRGKVEIKAPIQNLKVNAGDLEFYAEDLSGKPEISAAKCVLTFVHRKFNPISYKINCGSAQIKSLLSKNYKTICSLVSGGKVQLKESSFPLQAESTKSDFNLSGSAGQADIFFHSLD